VNRLPTQDKEPEKPIDEEVKKQAPCAEGEKKPEEAKEESAPKWALELAAKIEKLTDAILVSAKAGEKETYPPAEKKPEEKADEKKSEEEVKPKEEVKADKKPEAYPYDEKKLNDMIGLAIKSSMGTEVEKAITKRFTEEAPEKKAKAPAPGAVEGKDLSFEEFGQLSFQEIHRLAKARGA